MANWDIQLHRNSARRQETPLYCAARMGLEDMAQLLIDRGADPNWLWQHEGGVTPLCVASAMEHPNVLRVLLNAGADPNRAGRLCGYSPLHWAFIRQNNEIANMLRAERVTDSEILRRYLPNSWYNLKRHDGVNLQSPWIVMIFPFDVLLNI